MRNETIVSNRLIAEMTSVLIVIELVEIIPTARERERQRERHTQRERQSERDSERQRQRER
jgi:hypothetical protein